MPVSGSQRGILDGIKVVELATVIAGPVAAALLCDMGATVIKVEAPQGDAYRTMTRTVPGQPFSACFEHCNRGKQSVVLDLKTAEDMDVMKQLLAGADVFVTNVRSKALKGLGLDFEALHGRHPRLIFAHLTAWGLGGPEQDNPGYDVGAFWAGSGLMKYVMANDEPGTPAPRFPGGVGDSTTSIHLMAGVLGALYDRERTGQGQFVEACIYRAGLWSMAIPATNAMCVRAMTNGQGRLRADPQTAFDTPTYNSYACKDGAWIQLLGLEMERHFDKIMGAIDPEGHTRSSEPFKGDAKVVTERVLPDDELRILLIKKMAECFLRRTAAEWAAIFNEKDIWFHSVTDINDVLDDAQYNAIGAFSEIGGPQRLVSHPIKFGAALPVPRGRAPELGAHNQKIIDDLKAGRW